MGALYEIAEIQATTMNFGAGLRAIRKCLALVQSLDDKESQANCLCTMATIQLSIFVEKVLSDPKQQSQKVDEEETLKAQEKALDFCTKTSEKKLAIPMIHGIAQVYLVKRNSELAMEQITKADDLCEKYNDEQGQVVGMILSSYCLILEQKNSKAQELADKALALATKNKDEAGEQLANNIKDLLTAMTAGSGGEGGEDAAAVDPEMLKLKIQDVANSLMGIESLAGDTPLMDAGLDSLSMVEFRNELVKEFPGVDLPGSLLFDYPTVNVLAEYVAEGLNAGAKAVGG